MRHKDCRKVFSALTRTAGANYICWCCCRNNLPVWRMWIISFHSYTLSPLLLFSASLSLGFFPLFQMHFYAQNFPRSKRRGTQFAWWSCQGGCQQHTGAPVSIWLHSLNCTLNLYAERVRNETNNVRRTAVTLHTGCRTLKHICLYCVSPSMTNTGRLVLLQKHFKKTRQVHKEFSYLLNPDQ